MKLVIFGSRNIRISVEEIDYALALTEWEPVTSLICGMARGVDDSGLTWAARHGIGVTPFPADWNKYGKRAGFIRNAQMADVADAGLGFWKDDSGGTASMVAHLVLRQKRVRLF